MPVSKEIWRPVVGFEGLYEVSDAGNVRSVDRIVTSKNGMKKSLRGQLLKQGLYNSKSTYRGVTLSKGGKQFKKSVHRLVAEAFIQNPDGMPEINHKDEDKANNTVENLEWCDRQYNNTYGTARFRIAATQGKPVIQKKNGKIVNAYPTQGVAAMFTGASQSGISACCRGEMNSSGGYEWSWAPWG